MDITAGYKAFNGYVFTESDAAAYNRISAEIDAERYAPTKEFLKDQRHKLFCMFIGIHGY